MCPISHDVLRDDDAEWSALPAIKPWQVAPGEVLLMRNAPCCNSTLARTMAPQDSDEE